MLIFSKKGMSFLEVFIALLLASTFSVGIFMALLKAYSQASLALQEGIAVLAIHNARESKIANRSMITWAAETQRMLPLAIVSRYPTASVCWSLDACLEA